MMTPITTALSARALAMSPPLPFAWGIGLVSDAPREVVPGTAVEEASCAEAESKAAPGGAWSTIGPRMGVAAGGGAGAANRPRASGAPWPAGNIAGPPTKAIGEPAGGVAGRGAWNAPGGGAWTAGAGPADP